MPKLNSTKTAKTNVNIAAEILIIYIDFICPENELTSKNNEAKPANADKNAVSLNSIMIFLFISFIYPNILKKTQLKPI